MSDLVGNHIVGFPKRRLIYIQIHIFINIALIRCHAIGRGGGGGGVGELLGSRVCYCDEIASIQYTESVYIQW